MYDEKRINQLEGRPNYAERLNCIFHGEDKKKIMYQLIPRVVQTGRLFCCKKITYGLMGKTVIYRLTTLLNHI